MTAPPPRRRAQVVVCLAVFALLTSAWVYDRDRRDAGEVGLSMVNLDWGAASSHWENTPGQHVSVGIGGFCVRGYQPGHHVEITKIEPINPRGGLRIAAFTVRPNPAERGEPVFAADGNSDVALADTGIPIVHTLDFHCTADDLPTRTAEIIFDYVRDDAATGDSDGLALHWRAEDPWRLMGRSGTLRIDYREILCAADDAVHPECKIASHRRAEEDASRSASSKTPSASS